MNSTHPMDSVPMPEPTDEAQAAQTKFPYCGKTDSTWLAEDLLNGKRSLPSGEPGVNYHCITAFYGAQ